MTPRLTRPLSTPRRLALGTTVIATAGLLLAPLPAAAAPVTAGAPAADAHSAAEAEERVRPYTEKADKSIAFYVGSDLTADGHTLIGGFGHEPSSHWVEIVPAQSHPEGATITVGVTPDAEMPGELTEIPQVAETYRYITSNYSEFAGFPAPLTNGGLNENNVAARDVWSNSREELWDMTPTDQTGPQYSDLSRIAMERATTAEEAVDILGALIDEHGYSTYGGNSHMFADENEGWIFIEYSGGEGLWAAERMGSDEVRVSYPGYIQDFPVDAVEGSHPDFRGSANLVSFATEMDWYDPERDEVFDLQAVYQQPFPSDAFEVGEIADADNTAPYRNPVSLEAELRELAPVSLQDMQRLVRDPRWSDDRAGYGQVAELRSDLADPRLATLWVAPTAAVTAPYTPIAIGTESLPVEFAQHRYLTADASSTYLDPSYAEQEASEYATQTFKRLLYATCSRPEEYLGDVTSALEGHEARILDEWNDIQRDAADAIDRGEDPSAVLTDYTSDSALRGLALGNHLLDDVLTRSRENGGLQEPTREVPAGTTASARSLPMTFEGFSSRDRMNCDLGGGWADGSTLDRQGAYGDPADVPDLSDARISGYAVGEGSASQGADGIGAAAPWLIGGGALLVGALGGLVIGRVTAKNRR